MEKSKVNDVMQLVVFKVDGNYYGVDIRDVDEIGKISKDDLTNLPQGMQNYYSGTINIRGKIMNTISMRKRFGLEEKPLDDNSRFIIIEERAGNYKTIIVDSVEKVLRVPPTSIHVNSLHSSNFHPDFLVGGTINIEGEEIVILKPEKI